MASSVCASRGLAKMLAVLRRLAGGQERGRGRGIGGEARLVLLPLVGHQLCHGEAVTRVGDGGRNRLGQRRWCRSA